MKYRLKELFWSIQGEGRNAGVPSVFVRFSGCNRWTGLERDRASGSADCARWCDTDFQDGEWVDHDALLPRIAAQRAHARLVVFTGGEPALQLTKELLRDGAGLGLQCAIETNGTVRLPEADCWKTVSPKGGKHPLVVTAGDELKLVLLSYSILPLDVCTFTCDGSYSRARSFANSSPSCFVLNC